MNSSQTQQADRERTFLGRHGLWILAALVLVGGGLVAVWWSQGRTGVTEADNQALFTVKRGRLPITVPVSGTLRSEQARVLESQVEGTATITELAKEGTRVKEGDLLVQMDTSQLEDEKRQAELELQNAQAAYVNAQQNLEITRRQGEADINAAKTALTLARNNLREYLGVKSLESLHLDQIDLEQYFADESPTQLAVSLPADNVLSRIKQLNQIPLTPTRKRVRQRLTTLAEADDPAAQKLARRLEAALTGTAPEEASTNEPADADEQAQARHKTPDLRLAQADGAPPSFNPDKQAAPQTTRSAVNGQSQPYREQVQQLVTRALNSDHAFGPEVTDTLKQIEQAVTGPSYDEKLQNLLDQLDGQYKQSVQEALNNIRIAEAELTRINDRLEGSRTLAEKGYITQRELEADMLEQQRRKSEVLKTRGSLRLLRKFTFEGKIAQLENDLEQKQFQLTKARHAKESNIINAEANLASKKEHLAGEKEHLEEIKQQIAYATIRAPTDGLVIYAERDDDERPLDVGVQVRQREDLIRLPTVDSMMAVVDIHESMVQKVSEGMAAEITTNAVSDTTFTGEVTHVATQPDRGHRWLNPGRRVFKTRIAIKDAKKGLRPGMSCDAEIIVKRFDDVVYVPLQCVVRVNGQSRVYVPGPDGPQPRTVETGMDNNKMVRIKSGLKEGEQVLLTPPLPSTSSEQQDQRRGRDEDTNHNGNSQANRRDAGAGSQ